MPIYEYKCKKGHRFEVRQSFSDDPVSTCEVCGATVQRVFHPIAVHFKGSGFYNTDYGTKKRSREMKEAKEGAKAEGAKAEGGKESASSAGSDSGGSKSDSGSSSSSDAGGSKSDSGRSKSDSGGSKSDSGGSKSASGSKKSESRA